MRIEDEFLGTLTLLQMDVGVLEGETIFFYSIFDPSVNQCSLQAINKLKLVFRFSNAVLTHFRKF